MSKTGPEIRHEAKERMKKYRAEMTAKGYISTTVFLSQEHRAELKRLGDEHRLTRAEAAEHIFQAYLQSDNKDTVQIYNTNIEQQTETSARLESLEARLKALEERDPKPAIDPELEEELSDYPPGDMPDQPADILDGIDPENLTVEDRDRLVLKLHEQFPDKTQAKHRIKVLNDAGVLFNGKPWTTKQYSDQLHIARKRAKK